MLDKNYHAWGHFFFKIIAQMFAGVGVYPYLCISIHTKKRTMTDNQKAMFKIEQGDNNRTKIQKMDRFVSSNWSVLVEGAIKVGALNGGFIVVISYNGVTLDFQIETVKTHIFNWDRRNTKEGIPDEVVNKAAYTIEKLMEMGKK